MRSRNGARLHTAGMPALPLDLLSSLSPLSLLIDLSLGVVLGAVGGLFGIGGGLIAIPVLALGFGLDQQLAQGTALVMIAPNVMLGFWRYKQRNPIDLRDASWLGGTAVGSTWLVAHWATRLDAGHLRWAFAAFLVGLAALLFWGARRRKQAMARAVPELATPAALNRPGPGQRGVLGPVHGGWGPGDRAGADHGVRGAPADDGAGAVAGCGGAGCAGGPVHLRDGWQGGLVARFAAGGGRFAQHLMGRCPGAQAA